MRKLILTAAMALALSPAAHAQQIIYHSSDLPYDSLTATCEEILAHAQHNKYTRLEAASLYIHGKHMGKKCLKIDYIKAFELYAQAGEPRLIQHTLARLQSKADSGHAGTRFLLRKLKKAGYELED